MIACLKAFLKKVKSPLAISRKGQTLVEYALILAVISVVAIGVFAELNHHLAVIFSDIDSLLDTAQASH